MIILKKIYAKFTKERAPEFQIETAIYETEDGKKVSKRPLTDLAKEHVERMYQNYIYFCAHGSEYYTPCQKAGKEIMFSFIRGDTFYTRLLTALREEKIDQFFVLLQEYQDFVRNFCLQDTEEFQMTQEFQSIFGEQEGLEGKEASKMLNIDLTLDNIILEEESGKPQIIDYEWVFPFPIPVDFIFYRTVLAMYIKHGQELTQLVDPENLYELFHLSPQDREIYQSMNESFNSYVNGGEDAYEKIVEPYRKKMYEWDRLKGESIQFTQIFAAKDLNFKEEDSMVMRLDETQTKVKAVMNLKKFDHIGMLRFDPLNGPCEIEMGKIYLYVGETKKEIFHQDLKNNAVLNRGNLYLFSGEDPMFLIPMDPEMKWDKVEVNFQFLLKDEIRQGQIEQMVRLVNDTENRLARKLVELESRCEQITELKEEILKLEGRLKFIESTRAYRWFIKKRLKKFFDLE